MEDDSRPPSRTSWLRKLASKVTWYLLRSIGSLILPIIQYLAVLCAIMVFSLIGYQFIRTSLVPKALIMEPLYFNFAQVPPMARVSLSSREKQWLYSSDCSMHDGKKSKLNEDSNPTLENLNEEVDYKSGKFSRSESARACYGLDRRRFLRAGFRYSIDVVFGLASSSKNIKMGKFMVYTSVIDSTGATVALSSRPVVIPYQSRVSLILDALIKYPLRVIGILKTSEVSKVIIPVMNDFQEPSETFRRSVLQGSSLISEHIELRLSSSDVDVDNAVLTVMPKLNGITWLMHYYPYASWIVGVTFITIFQISFVLALLCVWYLGNLLLGDKRNNIEGSDDDDDNDDDNDDDEYEDDGDGYGERVGREDGVRQDNPSNESNEQVPLTPPILLSPFRFRSRPVIPAPSPTLQPAKIHVPATSISLPPTSPLSAQQSTYRPVAIAQPTIALRNLDLNLVQNLDQNPELDTEQSPTLRRRKVKPQSPPGTNP